MRDYSLERKIINAINPVVFSHPRLGMTFRETDGSIILHFSYFQTENDGFLGLTFAMKWIVVQCPDTKDYDRLDLTYINRRLGYSPIPTDKKGHFDVFWDSSYRR